jgi:lysophospholipase L1-like esterase
MKFSSTLTRLLWRGSFAAAVTALALVACGGGTRVEDYHPNRIIAFGDEYSVLEAATAASAAEATASQASIAGRKYTVNAYELNASSVAQSNFDCRSNPLWIQHVAGAFGLTFQGCQGTATSATGVTRAVLGAKAADVKTQVDNFLATSGNSFTDKDLVTVMAGQNDVLELYAAFPATGADTLIAAAGDRAKLLAQEANRVATSGPAVLVMRIPNVDLTPFGQAQTSDGRNLLRKLTEAFNVALQLNLINDGHLIGLVYGDAEINNMHDFAAAYGISNVTAAWCATPATAQLLDCTTKTPSAAASAASATAGSYLWAGDTILGPTGQSRLGTLAADRALNNPF